MLVSNSVYSDHVTQKGYSSLLSFTVTDINSTVTKLMALGAELDGPIKYEIHGKVLSFVSTKFFLPDSFSGLILISNCKNYLLVIRLQPCVVLMVMC